MPEIPTFETARLLLRGVTQADAPAIQKNFNDYAVIRELASIVPWPYPADGALDFIRNHVLPAQGNGRWVWGLFLKDAPQELIGIIDLRRIGKPEHRGFWLARKHWGKGLMTEATTVITDHAFDELGFEALIFSNAVGNVRSRRIKEKSNAVLCRIEPAKFVNPDYTQHEVWELTKSAWKKHHSAATKAGLP
jgi:[ribosomal protein S5]-alanine N-acetyltransferase